MVAFFALCPTNTYFGERMPVGSFLVETCYFISFCELKPEAQAAWVQAVFSVVGIGVAILVPWQLRRAELEDRRCRNADISRDVALLLLPSVQRWRELFSTSPESGERSFHAVFNDSYKVPPEIVEDVERLHLLGPAARYLQAAVFLAREVEANPQAVKEHLRGDHVVSNSKTPATPTWEDKLDLLVKNLENAEREMKQLFADVIPK